MPWLVAAGIYVLLMVLGPRLLADPDTYSHIALGRWILEHHAVPTGDPFSQTMRGEHWVAFEWLSQVAYAAALSLGGWVGVVALAAAAAAAAFGLLTRFLLREWQPVPTLIAVLAAFVLASPHILARPHMLALPLMVAWVAALIRAVDERRAPPWQLLPLMTLWANLHGSFTFGLAIIGAIACDALWNAPASERLRVARQWMLFGVLALAAACLNPYGPEMILVTFRTVALGDALSIITEWRPQDFSHLGAFEIIMLAGFGYRALPRREIAAAAHSHAVRRSASQPVAIAARRSARIAGAAVSGAAAGRTIRRDRRAPDRARAQIGAGCRRAGLLLVAVTGFAAIAA